MARAIALLLTVCSIASAMDPVRGKEVLREQNCLACHNVHGDGSIKAPDLSARLVDHYTPAALASLLWNHLPEMWTAIQKDATPRPQVSTSDAEDLFGYLYSEHFANPPGNEIRGERAFEQRGCAACHTKGPGMPVENWKGIRDPFTLAQQMWNHAPAMRDAREKRGVLFERLSSRDVADITAYASRGLARSTGPATLPETGQGEALFKSNCGGCHPAVVDLRKRMRDRTPLEVASTMWNHATSMQNVSLGGANDMRGIVGYVWNLQFTSQGDAARGAKTFDDKGCSACHQQMNRGERVFSPYSMIALWWKHGPSMAADVAKTSAKNKKARARWQLLSADEVDDLVAFMNRRP
jgi:mono/diheme cytochrome c family protein